MVAVVAMLSGLTAGAAWADGPATMTVGTVEASPGSTVSVDVSIANNPGILGTTLQVDYDEGLTLTGGVQGEAFAGLTMTKPKDLTVKPCKFPFDGQDIDPSAVKDGTVLTLVFDVSASATAGQELGVRLTCEQPINGNLEVVDVTVVNGAVKIAGGDEPPVAEPDSLTASKDVTSYEVGSALDLSDLHVFVGYSDNTIRQLAATEYTVDSTAVDMSTPGVYPLSVTYTENPTLSGSVMITVDAVLESISASKTKTTYYVDELLNVNDINVLATYSGNQRKRVTNYTTDAASIDMSTAGEKTLTVTYVEGDKTATDTIAIIVEKPELLSITATKAKTTYTEGDELNVDDVIVVATYAGNKRIKVTDFTTNAADIDMSTVGVKTLTVTFVDDEKTVTADIAITVNEAGTVNPGESDLMYIEVTEPENGEYYFMVGDKLDLGNLKVEATYLSKDDPVVLDSSQYEIDYSDLYADPEYEWTVDAIDEDGTLIEEGFYLLKVTVKGEDPENYAYISINVGSSSYLIEAEKEKQVYAPGEDVTLSDLKVTVRYADGSVAESICDNDLDGSISVTIREAGDDEAYGELLEDADLNKIGDYELIVRYQEGFGQEAVAIVPISIRRDVEKAAVNAKILETSAYSTSFLFGLPAVPDVEVPGLVEGRDYRVQYANNVNAGTGKVLIIGMGEYSGVKELFFTIKPLSIVFAQPSANVKSVTCTGKAFKPGVTFGMGSLVENVDYKVSYKNNVNVGEASLTVTGMGNYIGSSTMEFKILPGKVALDKVKSTKKKKVTVTWGKMPGGVKYQVSYRVGKGKWKTKTVSKNKLTIKKLKPRKKCTVRVRAFKTVNGENWYGAWSKSKKVKVK